MKLLFLTLLFFPVLVSADVYTWVNEQGVRVYGDEPPAHANKAELPALQQVKMPKVVQKEKPEEEEVKDSFEGYQSLKIISPKEDHAITSGAAGNVSIQVHIQPELQPEHEVTLLHNGQIIESSRSLHFSLSNLNRGSHLLQVRVKHKGVTLISSQNRRIHVHRPSILNRPRP